MPSLLHHTNTHHNSDTGSVPIHLSLTHILSNKPHKAQKRYADIFMQLQVKKWSKDMLISVTTENASQV